MANNSNVKKSILFNSIGSFTYLFSQWLITYVIIFINGYSDAGIFSVVMSLGATFYSLSLFGMRGFQSTDLKGEYSEKTYFMSRLLVSIVAIVASIIYTIYKDYNLYTILCINFYVLFKISESVIDVIHGTLQKKWLYKNIGISLTLRGIINLLVFTITLIISKNLLLSIVCMGISSYLSIYFYDVMIYKKEKINFGTTNKKEIKRILLFCLPLAIYTTISNYTAAVPKIAISNFFDEKILGIYTAYANPAMIIQVAAGFFISPLTTYFAEIYNTNNIKKLTKSIFKCILVIFVIGILVIIINELCGLSIFKLVFGKDLVNYYYLMNQMIVISVLTAIMWLFSGIIVIMRKFWYLIIINLIYFAIIRIFSNYAVIKYNLSGINYLIMISIIIVIILYSITIIFDLKRSANK